MAKGERIAIFGADGQLGTALCTVLGARALPLKGAEIDFTQPQAFSQALSHLENVSAIINAAAYTAVDKAEAEPDIALAVNAKAPEEMAKYCKKRGIPLVHYSTDYVYSGKGSAPWDEDSPAAPLNMYGKSKLAGDEAIAASGCRYLIFRTSWVYSAVGNNFFLTMLKLGAARETLSVVSDQHGAPCYAPDLAAASLKGLSYALSLPEFPSGIYHLTNQGETSWHGFAKAIFALARAEGITLALRELTPIPSSAYPTPAARPLNSRLNCQKAKDVLHLALPEWQISLNECMERYHP